MRWFSTLSLPSCFCMTGSPVSEKPGQVKSASPEAFFNWSKASSRTAPRSFSRKPMPPSALSDQTSRIAPRRAYSAWS